MGCPTGADSTNIRVMREIYTLSASAETKFADWVAYKVTAGSIGTSKDMNRGWQSDDLLPADSTLEPSDYKGASSALQIDRGHQAPLAAFAGTIYWRDTNILSNITPQKKNLNQGPWRLLEEAVRDLAYDKRAVYVLTGPIYDGERMTLPQADEAHQIPTGYWKIVHTSTGQYAAYIMDQDMARRAPYCGASATLADIEKATRLDFFPFAPAGWAKPGLEPALGC